MSFLAHEENGLLIKTSTVLSGVRHGFSTRPVFLHRLYVLQIKMYTHGTYCKKRLTGR